MKIRRWLKKHKLEQSSNNACHSDNAKTSSIPKVPRPIINMDISQIAFDQFCFEWSIYKKHYNIPESDIASHLLYSCDSKVRQRLRIEQPEFATKTYTEKELLGIICNITLSKRSHIIHTKEFYDISQKDDESCIEFLGRLEIKASCCNFKCEHCDRISINSREKERFIIGLNDPKIQTAIIKTEFLLYRVYF